VLLASALAVSSGAAAVEARPGRAAAAAAPAASTATASTARTRATASTARTRATASAAPAAASGSRPAPSLAVLGERIAERMHANARRTAGAGDGRPDLVKLAGHPRDKAAPAHDRTARGAGAHGRWGYGGDAGPLAWGRLKPEFARCASGQRQSPIDIQGGIRVRLDPVAFDYRPGPFRVVDTGHTVQVEVAPGSSIEVLGRRFELLQFHFHRPSEERVDGRAYDMVVHLVHQDLDGRLAVVAVLLERGSAQPIVQTVWNHLPLEQDEPVAVPSGLDPAGLLPEERGYYTYMGSLTTPPCSEGVLWMVMKQPVAVSEAQIGIFARLYPMNARPIQAASGRLIKESE
jgi:carbonic anhydrase